MLKFLFTTGRIRLLLFTFFYITSALSDVDATNPPKDQYDYTPSCTSPIKRKEWRTLSKSEKKRYIAAVKCLQSRPTIAQATFSAARTRFDDFQGVHISLSNFIHFVGQFLPWHRYYLHAYEKALREECGYRGGQPYWNWDLDAGNFEASPVFDPKTGFGGNGVFQNCTLPPPACIPGGTGGGCITDGPFAKLTLRLGPRNNTEIANTRCLTRDFHPDIANLLFQRNFTDFVMSLPAYNEFRLELEGTERDLFTLGKHGAGHVGVGGNMRDLQSSPGDPLFYLHHAMIDKMWWDWQNLDPENRMYEVSGNAFVEPNPTGANVTLDTLIGLGPVGEEVPIRDVMNIMDGILCNVYV